MKGNEYYKLLKQTVKDKKENKIDFDDMGKILLGEENRWSSENFRKFFYIIQPILEKIEEEGLSELNVDTLKEIEEAKDNLYKERVRLQDKKRELNKILREEARFERMMEILEENIENLDNLGFSPLVFSDKKMEATLLLSDLHIGLIVDNQLNFFNKDVAIERLKQVVDKTIKHCTINDVNKLNIVLNGDLISGIINLSGRVEQEEDIMTQAISCSEILSHCINELSNYFEVIVYATYGNHSRVFLNKKEGLPRENFERMIFEFIKLRVPHIKLIDSKGADYLTYKVDGKTIFVSHGDNDSLNNVKQHVVNLLGFVPKMCLMGHIHHFNVKNDNDTIIVTNGSLISTDSYAVSLRKSTKPSQTLIIHSEDDLFIELKLE